MDIMEEYEMLNGRQKSQAEDYAKLATEYGMFDQTTGANGAHYAPAAVNPFKAEGMVCKNCVFFDEASNQCQIVSGILEPEAVCKLWVIPETLLTTVEPAPEEPMAESVKPVTESAKPLVEAYIRKGAPGCKGWATTDHTGKVITCHKSKSDAIKHMVAASIGAGVKPGGTWSPKKKK